MVAAVSSKTPLVLVGAGGLGREVAAGIQRVGGPLEVIGFIDDTKNGPTVLGPIVGHVPIPDAVYITCFGDGAARTRIRKQLQAKGARFTSLVSPHGHYIDPPCDAVNGMFMGMCTLSNDTVLGADIFVQTLSVVGHDVRFGDGVTLGTHSFVGGYAELGDFCTIHPHATILPKVKVGRGAVVGAGSVVIRNVEPYTTVFGAPAKLIARRAPDA